LHCAGDTHNRFSQENNEVTEGSGPQAGGDKEVKLPIAMPDEDQRSDREVVEG
jgi:hypothetical protein